MNFTKYSDDFPKLLYIVRNSGNPKYIEFTTFASRLRTFDLFNAKHPNKFVLCEAGFKFLGTADCVQCFNCGLLLYKWRTTDDPWKEHAFHSPYCSFVLLKKGNQFIESVIREKQNIVHDCGCKGHDTVD